MPELVGLVAKSVRRALFLLQRSAVFVIFDEIRVNLDGGVIFDAFASIDEVLDFAVQETHLTVVLRHLRCWGNHLGILREPLT